MQIFHANVAHAVHLLGVVPDLIQRLLAHVAARDGKLHAREDFAIGGYVNRSVSSAAGNALQKIIGRRSGRFAEFVNVADEG